MRELLLFRHAKSSWEAPSLDDFDRPLSDRGRRDAPRMAGEMNHRGWFPQRALVSPARRTRDTWTMAGDCLPAACETVFEETIYEASPQAILAAIQATPDHVTSLVVVGHNPGLEELAEMIVATDSDVTAQSRLRRKFPTAGLARFEMDRPWSSLGRESARLTHFVTPRDLG
jgi:phosphohistidine phosphatase